jgi:hypothetical protein
MSKISFTNWFTKTSSNKDKPLGSSLGSKDGIKAEIAKMQGDIIKTSKTYQTNIKKYKEIAKLNEEITKSYVNNLAVFVDVSEMLNSCLAVFKSLKEEFGKMEEVMGKQLDVADFEYLTNITKNKIDTLNVEFNKQAENIKRIYTEHGKPEELNRIIVAQGNMQKLIDTATTTYDVVAIPSNSSDPNSSTVIATSLTGGDKKKKSKSVKKNVAKTTNKTTLKNQGKK